MNLTSSQRSVLNLSAAQEKLLDQIGHETAGDWVEIFPNERRTAQALLDKDVIDVYRNLQNQIIEARLKFETAEEILAGEDVCDTMQTAARMNKMYPLSAETIEWSWLS